MERQRVNLGAKGFFGTERGREVDDFNFGNEMKESR